MRVKCSIMSITADNLQKLQQDLHVELITANELLLSISEEVQKIKSITSQGGELESTIKQNASLMANLADMQKLDITKLPPVARTLMNLGQQANQNTSMDE